MNIVIPHPLKVPEPYLGKILSKAIHTYDNVPHSEEELIRRIANAEIITANYINITPSIIDACPALRYIVVPSSGYEFVDCEYARKFGIIVSNCPTYSANAVAEHVFGLMLSLARKILLADSSLAKGEWLHPEITGHELNNKQLGIIGYGEIGKRVSRIARGFGMSVAYTTSASTSQECDNLLKNSDYIVVALPFNLKTRNFIDARKIKLLKKTAVIINISRGGVMDYSALQAALANNAIGGAGLDVFMNEPMEGTPDPSITALASLPNTVTTPHIAFKTAESLDRLGKELLDTIESCLAGGPINVVN